MDHIIDKGDPEQKHKPKQKRFWSFIKSLRKDSSGIAPLKENGRLHAEPKDKADILNRQYESTWTKEDKSSIPSPDGTPFPSMPEIEVINEGVVKLLLKLNPNKASGPDLLPARVLKEMATEIGPFLTIIFQKSFDTGIVPKDWRTANVTVIFKKGRNTKHQITGQSPLPVYAARFRNILLPATFSNTWMNMRYSQTANMVLEPGEAAKHNCLH